MEPFYSSCGFKKLTVSLSMGDLFKDMCPGAQENQII